ncbi:MAG: Gfo/Idh/MocA family protein [Candidatus Methylomirabilales bacterium]
MKPWRLSPKRTGLGRMMLRGAIIGLGNVAIHGHLPGWLARRDIEIVAGTDTNAAQARELRSHVPQARWYDSLDELLAGEGLDFVDICTPPATHADLIRTALERGLHVLCEKPLVTRLGDLDAVGKLVGEKARVLYTVHNWHQAPVIRKVSELLREGAIGEIRGCGWQTLRTQPAGSGESRMGNWRIDPAMAGGGVLMDHGWHAFYVLSEWLGEVPTRISAHLETRRHVEWPVEDTATVRLQFPSTTAEIFLTWTSDVRRNWARLEGTRGEIRLEDDTVVLMPRPTGNEQRWPCPPALSSGSYHPDWFSGVASGFVAEVTGRSAVRGATVAEASLCATLVALAQESSRQGGKSVPVPEPSELGAVEATWNR